MNTTFESSTPEGSRVLNITDKAKLTLQPLTPEQKTVFNLAAAEVSTKLQRKPPVGPGGKMFGKPAYQNRSVGFFSDVSVGYRYSSQLMASQPLPPFLAVFLACINEMFQANFNGVLVNLYLNGEDYISDHSDDENGLDPKNKAVVAVSLGAERTMHFKNKDKTLPAKERLIYKYKTVPYECMQMSGEEFQRLVTHGIPAEPKIKEERLSFTFRYHID